MPTKSELCLKCFDCCKWFVLEVRKPDLPQEVIDWKEWMSARGITVVRENSKWWRLKIPFPCPHLRVVEKDTLIITPEHSKDTLGYCEIYPTRPKICAKFDGRLEDPRDNLKCLWKTEKIN